MRINPLTSFSNISKRRTKTCSSEQQTASNPSLQTFKGSSLGGGTVAVAEQIATSSFAAFSALMSVMFAAGVALTIKSNEDVREGKYDLKDIYGDRGEWDRMCG